MKIQRQFETKRATALREMAQIETLLRNLSDAAARLESDVAAEEERAGISDVANAAYPIVARVLSVRRRNLKATIATFEERLANLQQIFLGRGNAAKTGDTNSLVAVRNSLAEAWQ